MGHPETAQLVQYGLIVWLSALAAVIFFRILTRGTQFGGLLANDPYNPATSGMAPERVQLLAVFVFSVAAYAIHSLATGLTKDAATGLFRMPDAPQSLLVLLGASHSIYLSGKLGRKISGK